MREQTRQRLFTAAVELVAEQGFSGTTVDQIAARAGVAKGTVFYNFDSKEQLFAELLRHTARRVAEILRAAVAGRHGYDAIEALVRAELEHATANPAFTQIVLAELYRTGRPWQRVLVEVREEVAGVVRDVIVDGQRRGDLDAALDADFAAGALLGVTLVVTLDWLAFAPDRSFDEVLAATVRMVRGRLAVGS